jgi:hypothetical protein
MLSLEAGKGGNHEQEERVESEGGSRRPESSGKSGERLSEASSDRRGQIQGTD